MKRQKLESQVPNSFDISLPIKVWTKESGSCFVLDTESIRWLWENGNFGKGTWSRSQPAAHFQENAEIQTELYREHSQELLQLSQYEVVYLQWALGSIQVWHVHQNRVLPAKEMWKRFCVNSLKFSTDICGKQLLDALLREDFKDFESMLNLIHQPTELFITDNSFILRYLAYHFYRNQGWTVRQGTKYGVDWLLYRHGPTMDHAEFGVRIQFGGDQSESCLQIIKDSRILSSVKKKMILCHLTLLERAKLDLRTVFLLYCDPARLCELFAVDDFQISRWIPEKIHSEKRTE